MVWWAICWLWRLVLPQRRLVGRGKAVWLVGDCLASGGGLLVRGGFVGLGESFCRGEICWLGGTGLLEGLLVLLEGRLVGVGA